MEKRIIKKEDGFTMIEVLTSMVIMAFALLMLLHMAMVALDGNNWASGTTNTVQSIQEKLEDLRTQPNPQSGEDTLNNVIRRWRVTVVDSHLRRVDIVAIWTSVNNQTHTNDFYTFFKTDSL
jgi:prepilin-type N-terminal cleavage/methylation domain-containing protein